MSGAQDVFVTQWLVAHSQPELNSYSKQDAGPKTRSCFRFSVVECACAIGQMETDMGNVGYRIVHCWGSRSRLNIAEYLWVLAMFSILAFLENNRIGLYLIPPFGATLTILLAVPDAPVAQPYALVAGSVIGATVGTLLSFFSHGTLMAIVAAVAAFAIINLIHAYHPPGVALAMFPLLLHPGRWFPLAVVLPFTIIATGSATLLSKLVVGWPSYPKRLASRDFARLPYDRSPAPSK